ncbi:integrase arm-type DNA-binding domain-containing protein [Chitinibacter tainanensis]|uniref:tyrosine-type recombinase/integrase n=1 Tax=Chitinibacter tainanensis TaxID=230667 RepID=UPI0023559D5C|nr:integrase arm-type DNA-binding domain-containing protein [Chitinibacter tainanensis]
MAGKSKSDTLTVAELKSTIKAEQLAIDSGEAKAPRKIACGFGLQLWVMGGAGTALYWRLPYRYAGKQKLLACGVCDPAKPDLSEARQRAREAKDLIAAGTDPNQARQEEKRAQIYAAANSFEAVALEWYAKELKGSGWTEDHAETILQRLKANVFPLIGSAPIESLKTRDLLHPLQLVAKRNALDLAKRLRQYITAVMRYAVQTGRIETNPAHDLQGAIATRKAKHHAALPLTRLAELVAKIDDYKGLQVAKLATRFALLTGARSSEFRFARWDEFDLAAGTWTIPEQRSEVDGVKFSGRGEKMSRERLIYLSRQTVALLQELRAINGRAVFVFEGQKRGAPISENTVNLVLRKLGYNTQQDICLHGFRTMMVSSLNESLQFTHDAIERHIGHEGKAREGEAVAGIYKRKAQYLTERQRMLQWWADYLDASSKGPFIDPSEFKSEAIPDAPKLRIVA